MQFLIVAYDAEDEGAPTRRLEARQAHLDTIARYKASGNMHIGAALIGPEGKMMGSVIIADFPTREEMEAWLNEDPYVVHDVWGDIMIEECKIAPSFAK